MDIKCPHCGTEYEVEQKDLFHYTKCEVCGSGFVIGANTEPAAPKRLKTNEMSRQRGDGHESSVRTKDNDLRRGDVFTAKKNKIVAILCIVLGVMAVAGAGSYVAYLYFGDAPRLNRGIAYYASREYQRAYKILLPLAQKGYAKAQLVVGDCHANGQGVFMDTEEAVKWYRAAAAKELPEAQHRMFMCCRDGVGVERNIENAAKWCRKAAEVGLEEAMLDMGMLYVLGTGVEQNAKSAFKWFRKGAERGYPMALYRLGLCYKTGYGVEKDEDEASKWFNRAVVAWRTKSNEGNLQAMTNLAELYMQGEAVELDKEEGVKWYRRAAELGDAYAQFCFANCYYEGAGIEKDNEESAKWMLKAAEQGANRQSQRKMGYYYLIGIGVGKNYVEAVKWFERAAKKGDADSKYWLGICYLNGWGVSKDESRGEALIEASSSAGCENATKKLKQIRDERATEERRVARENAEKRSKIEHLQEVESEISERKDRINSILKGTLGGDWDGFDAGKIAQADSSISIKAECPLKKMAEKFSEKDSIETLDEALCALQKESERLKVRLAEIARVKSVYDATELESRKEICAQCGGKGSVECARCKGSGEVNARDHWLCPVCNRHNEYDDSSERRKGYVKVEEECNNCRGKGEVTKRSRCRSCGGRGWLKVSEPGRLDRKERCGSCGGSGGCEDSQSCPKCHGMGKVVVERQCSRCGGSGSVSTSRKETCPACHGIGSHECEPCGGRGFTYRQKQ